MERSSRPTRTPANLPESVNQQLNTHVLAATTAGVGMLAPAQPAEANIIYTRVNDAIPRHEAFNLDLNRDGKADFYFLHLFLLSPSQSGCGDPTGPCGEDD
jgi:hypothetical protein